MSRVFPLLVGAVIAKFGMRSHLGCFNKSSSCCRTLLAWEYGIQLSFWMWAMRSSIGLSSSSRVFGERWSPFISIRLDNALESFDPIRIAIGSRNRSRPGAGFRGTEFRRSRRWVSGRFVAHFPRAPCLFCFLFGFLFHPPHFLDGLENQDLVDPGITCIPQTLLGCLNLPSTNRRPRAIAVGDRDIGVAGGVPEIDFPHITRNDSKGEPARASGIFRVAGMNPGSQCIVPVIDVVDRDAVFLNGTLLERHEVEHKRGWCGNAIGQADARMISASKHSLLVLGQRRCFDAPMERIGINLGDIDGEPFFELRARHDGAALRIVVALLFYIGKCGAFEPPGPS